MVFRESFARAIGGTNKHSWMDAKLSRKMGTDRKRDERERDQGKGENAFHERKVKIIPSRHSQSGPKPSTEVPNSIC